MTTIKMEGQSFQIPDEIAASDDSIRGVLAPYFPEVATALITREEDGTVKIVKRAGTKGATLESLIAAPEAINPAVEKWQEIQKLHLAQPNTAELDFAALIDRQQAIASAIAQGRMEVNYCENVLRVLTNCPASPSPVVPLGFF